mmetsp:Transcript_91171/g.263022  ORF Transcript_91171/g.263022 Transcript_91171/m.263022 type:complete len:217 (+) Transcript_91171:258-908(+)
MPTLLTERQLQQTPRNVPPPPTASIANVLDGRGAPSENPLPGPGLVDAVLPETLSQVLGAKWCHGAGAKTGEASASSAPSALSPPSMSAASTVGILDNSAVISALPEPTVVATELDGDICNCDDEHVSDLELTTFVPRLGVLCRSGESASRVLLVEICRTACASRKVAKVSSACALMGLTVATTLVRALCKHSDSSNVSLESRKGTRLLDDGRARA